jgi:hypothetical protein
LRTNVQEQFHSFNAKRELFEGLNPKFYDLMHTKEMVVGDIVNPLDEVVIYEMTVNNKTEEELRSEYVKLYQDFLDSNDLRCFVIRLVWVVEL